MMCSIGYVTRRHCGYFFVDEHVVIGLSGDVNVYALERVHTMCHTFEYGAPNQQRDYIFLIGYVSSTVDAYLHVWSIMGFLQYD